MIRETKESKNIAIELTNACIMSCAYCTRNVRHVDEPFYLSITEFKRALKSLYGWKGKIILIGGEPTLHPNFKEICEIFKNEFPFIQRGLWSAGGRKFYEFRELIDETFGVLNFNNHKQDCNHQPNLIAIDEVIDDPQLKQELIENCWLQHLWSPSIGPNGTFFCEVAQSMDQIFKMKMGKKIQDNWWNEPIKEYFGKQIETFCNMCGACLPLAGESDKSREEKITKKNIERLKLANSPFIQKTGRIKEYKRKLSAEDITIMKENPLVTKNRYISDSTTSNYYYREYAGRDTRLSLLENKNKIQKEIKEEIKRKLTNSLSNSERFKIESD